MVNILVSLPPPFPLLLHFPPYRRPSFRFPCLQLPEFLLRRRALALILAAAAGFGDGADGVAEGVHRRGLHCGLRY